MDGERIKSVAELTEELKEKMQISLRYRETVPTCTRLEDLPGYTKSVEERLRDKMMMDLDHKVDLLLKHFGLYLEHKKR